MDSELHTARLTRLLTAFIVASALGACHSRTRARATTPTGARDDEQLVLTTITSENRTDEYRASSRKLASTPDWRPEYQPVPLPIVKAVSIARTESRIPPNEFVLISIELHPFPLAESTVRWYYQIEYYDRRDAFGEKPPTTKTVVLLMDGTAVSASQIDSKKDN